MEVGRPHLSQVNRGVRFNPEHHMRSFANFGLCGTGTAPLTMLSNTPRLGSKLTAILIAYLVVAIIAVGLTLIMSWQLEGGAAAVNEMGSQRMRAYRIALLLAQASASEQSVPASASKRNVAPSATLQSAPASASGDSTAGAQSANENVSATGGSRLQTPRATAAASARAEIVAFDRVLLDLQQGDPSRPLVLPRTREIQQRFEQLKARWQHEMRPAAQALIDAPDIAAKSTLLAAYLQRADSFVEQIDRLVLAIEHEISDNTRLLRMLQFGLIALSVVGTIALIYMLYLLIIRPVTNLEEGMRRMEAGDFGVRLPVESRDEFGALAAGFNRMAEHLQELYGSLERRVEEKTRTLADKNKELGTLYEVAALLSQPLTLEALCADFLRKLMARLDAQAGAVRLIEPDTGELHLFVHEGVSPAFTDTERCLKRDECLCGQGVQAAQPRVHILVRGAYRNQPLRCREEGFATVGVFPIRLRGQNLGLFNLYFTALREFSAQEQFMLETLGRHLGIAIENQRLVARQKEMAISEERNLLAQELHDSIAQSLAYLNIQAQLLQASLDSQQLDDAREELSRIREGIQESYDDVRELLVHFRTRMAQTDIEAAIATSLVRFESQAQVKTRFLQSGVGLPLSPEMQLQVMHIIQEALSNTRKHAAAENVEVEMQRGTVYRFWVRDDGKGFDSSQVPSDLHVGLRIMKERAHRIGGTLQVKSTIGKGTQVLLTLPVLEAGRARASSDAAQMEG